LATAACLRRAGVDALVLESAPRVGDGWRRHYDRLHLHTARALSGLPGLALPRSAGQWVARDEVAAYLERYARRHQLDVRTSTTVTSVRPGAGGQWEVVTGGGAIAARWVVVATGYNRCPYVPDWPGRDRFTGRVLHASAYRGPAPFRDRTVLVAGTGNSGAEIAVDLVEGGAARVRMAIRTPPHVLLREVNGMPGQVSGVLMRHLPIPIADALVTAATRSAVGDLPAYGIGRPPRGPT
jgi:putative flavoprotein involved in K+ transport